MKHATTLRYFAGTLGVAFGVGLPVAAASRGWLPVALPQELMVLVLASPAAVAMAMTGRRAGRSALRRLLWRTGPARLPLRWCALALGLPAAINAIALLLYAARGGTLPDLPGAVAPEQQVVPVWLLPLLFLTFSAAEEIGWRRFALPRLQVHVTALVASLVVGLVWSAWHLPMSLTAGSTQGSIDAGWYVMATLAMSVVFTWLYNSTGGSLAAVTLLHAGVQASNVVLPTLPAATGTDTVHRLTAMLTAALAVGIVVTCGPRDLSRRQRQVEPTKESGAALPGFLGEELRGDGRQLRDLLPGEP